MLIVKTNPMELRGISPRTKKKSGEVYYIVNAEIEDGTAFAFYCPNSSAFSPDLKKGYRVEITFEVTYYKNQERLVVRKVESVNKNV